jgi:hypothetical protein
VVKNLVRFGVLIFEKKKDYEIQKTEEIFVFLQYQMTSTYISSIQINLKDNKIVSGFSQTQQYILFYVYLDMFRSTDHHQASFTKLRIRYMQCQ